MHLATGKAAACLPLSIDDLLVDIFYYLDGSSQRKQRFKATQQELGNNCKKLVKHVFTKWLPLEVGILKALDQYDEVCSFFLEMKLPKNVHQSTFSSSV